MLMQTCILFISDPKKNKIAKKQDVAYSWLLKVRTWLRNLSVTTFSDCDTALWLYGIGKRVAMGKLTNNASFRNDVRVFINESTLDENNVAGKRALCYFYIAQSAPTKG